MGGRTAPGARNWERKESLSSALANLDGLRYPRPRLQAKTFKTGFPCVHPLLSLGLLDPVERRLTYSAVCEYFLLSHSLLSYGIKSWLAGSWFSKNGPGGGRMAHEKDAALRVHPLARERDPCAPRLWMDYWYQQARVITPYSCDK